MQLSHESVKLWLSVGWSLYVVVVGIWILLQRSQPIATLSWLCLLYTSDAADECCWV